MRLVAILLAASCILPACSGPVRTRRLRMRPTGAKAGYGGASGAEHAPSRRSSPRNEPVTVGKAGDDPADIARYILASGPTGVISPNGELIAFSWRITGAPPALDCPRSRAASRSSSPSATASPSSAGRRIRRLFFMAQTTTATNRRASASSTAEARSSRTRSRPRRRLPHLRRLPAGRPVAAFARPSATATTLTSTSPAQKVPQHRCRGPPSAPTCAPSHPMGRTPSSPKALARTPRHS